MSDPLPARVRYALSDALTLFALPCLAAILPWRWGFRLLKRCARYSWLCADAVNPAWECARTRYPNAQEQEFKYLNRLLRLIDSADTYLTLFHGSDWWIRHVDVQGSFPPPEAARMFLTYHWGSGHWIWRILSARGFHAGFVARRVEGRAMGMGRLSHWYARFRAWALPRIGSHGPIFVGVGREFLADTLRSGTSIVGMLDLPASGRQRAAIAPLLGRTARFPMGLAHLAVEHGAGITLFSAGLDVASGRRTLRLEPLPADLTADEVMQRYIAHLEIRLRETPEFWQIWREAPAIFVEPEETPPQAL